MFQRDFDPYHLVQTAATYFLLMSWCRSKVIMCHSSQHINTKASGSLGLAMMLDSFEVGEVGTWRVTQTKLYQHRPQKVFSTKLYVHLPFSQTKNRCHGKCHKRMQHASPEAEKGELGVAQRYTKTSYGRALYKDPTQARKTGCKSAAKL